MGSLFACAGEAEKPPNFILLIGDDMSVETVTCYGVGASPAKTPHIDQLCDSGVRFDNFWSQPVCSPTRATMLTGQFGFRNGVGTPATGPQIEYPVPDVPDASPTETGGRGGGRPARRSDDDAPAGDRRGPREIRENPNAQRPGYTEPPNERPSISADAYGLPAALSADASLAYQSAAVGKWHLSSEENGGLEHTRNIGFDFYAGGYDGGAVESYFAWSKVINGEITDGQTGYATTETVNDAIGWLQHKDADKPWLLWVAFNAPHSPYGAPPDDLLSEETIAKLSETDINENGHPFYAAMIEAMDTEIGRLLGSIPPEELANTYVIFIGDNGTPGNMATPPFSRNRVKGTVYQGGVNTPFVVTGPDVDGGTVSKALANSVDVFSTILDLAGVGDDERLNDVTLDAVSLAPVFRDHTAQVRDFAYADVFGPQQNQIANRRAIRDDRFKLVLDMQNDTTELYDLSVDPYEENDLLEQELGEEAQQGYDGLVNTLEDLLASK
jgi:arylsulfatase A-like enzyme